MTNSYYLTNDVDLRRSQLEAQATGRPSRRSRLVRRRFRDVFPAITVLESRKDLSLPAAPALGSGAP